jgi:hypothetical protein
MAGEMKLAGWIEVEAQKWEEAEYNIAWGGVKRKSSQPK